MGSILPIAVIGGIGYYVWKNWDSISSLVPLFGSATPDEIAKIIPTTQITTLPNIPLSITNPSGNPNVTVGSQINVPSNAASAESTYAKMSRWINSNIKWYTDRQGLATFDEWNSIRGGFESANEAIEDIFPGVDRNATMTLQEYFNGLTSKGVSGLSRSGSRSGLGLILNMEDFLGETPRVVRRGNFR